GHRTAPSDRETIGALRDPTVPFNLNRGPRMRQSHRPLENPQSVPAVEGPGLLPIAPVGGATGSRDHEADRQSLDRTPTRCRLLEDRPDLEETDIPGVRGPVGLDLPGEGGDNRVPEKAVLSREGIEQLGRGGTTTRHHR